MDGINPNRMQINNYVRRIDEEERRRMLEIDRRVRAIELFQQQLEQEMDRAWLEAIGKAPPQKPTN